MNDRANYFGDGVYDATVCVGYAINFLEEHVDRFYRSAAALGIVIPCAKNDLCALLRDLVLRLDSPDQFVYWQVTRGTAPRRHAFPAGPANLWVQLRPEAPATPAKPTACFGAGYPVSALPHQDAQSHPLGPGRPEGGAAWLRRSGLPPGWHCYRMRTFEYPHSKGRRLPHPSRPTATSCPASPAHICYGYAMPWGFPSASRPSRWKTCGRPTR